MLSTGFGQQTWASLRKVHTHRYAGQPESRGPTWCREAAPCPLYLRDSPGLRTVRRLRFAPSVGCGTSTMRRATSLQWVSLRTRGTQRWSVLLPERSDGCNQPSCAFGDPRRGFSPDEAAILSQKACTYTLRLRSPDPFGNLMLFLLRMLCAIFQI